MQSDSASSAFACRLFRETTLGELLFEHRELITCKATDTLEGALRTLGEHKIVSLPAVNDEGQFVGLLSLLDAVVHICGGADSVDADRLKTPVANVLGSSAESCALPYFEAAERLDAVCEHMVKTGRHRALVRFEGHGRTAHRVVTQTDLVAFAHKNVHKLGPLADTQVEELGVYSEAARRDLLVGRSEMSALDAFKIMAKHQISAIPIVNAEGLLVATLSASDLRGIQRQNLKALQSNVLEFLKERAQPQKQAVCTVRTSLREVLRRVNERRVHRLWLVDSEADAEAVQSEQTAQQEQQPQQQGEQREQLLPAHGHLLRSQPPAQPQAQAQAQAPLLPRPLGVLALREVLAKFVAVEFQGQAQAQAKKMDETLLGHVHPQALEALSAVPVDSEALR